MKKLIFKMSLFMAAGAFILSSCGKDDTPGTPGEDTSVKFSAKINGNTYTGVDIFGAVGTNSELAIGAFDQDDKYMFIGILHFDGEKTYSFDANLNADNGAFFIPDTSEFEGFTTFNENGGGSITVTKWDATDSLLSGNFSYTAANNDSVIQVTEGSYQNIRIRFDSELGGGENNNEFSVKIDGTDFSANGQSVSAVNISNSTISINAFDSNGNTFLITFPFDATTGTHEFGSDYTISYTEGNTVYLADSGSITISENDPANSHVEATFTFEGIDLVTSDTKSFTNGQFKVDYF